MCEGPLSYMVGGGGCVCVCENSLYADDTHMYAPVPSSVAAAYENTAEYALELSRGSPHCDRWHKHCSNRRLIALISTTTTRELDA